MRKLIPIICLIAIASSAVAHTFHVSLTELELNAKRVEVAVRVFNDDLEAALGKTRGERVTLDGTPGVDKLIHAYLQKHLALRDGEGKLVSWSWVGRETEVKSSWIYLEGSLQTPEKATIENSLFFELFADQVNSVNITRDTRKEGLAFTRGDVAKRLP